MKLYEIPAAMEALIDPETGEVKDPEQMEGLAARKEEIVEWLALQWKNAAAMEEALKEEKKEFEKRIKHQQSVKKGIAGYLAFSLGGKKLETARCKISFRKTQEAVRVEDEKKLLDFLKRNGIPAIRVKEELDKEKLKEVLKAGKEIPGVKLERGTSISIK